MLLRLFHYYFDSWSWGVNIQNLVCLKEFLDGDLKKNVYDLLEFHYIPLIKKKGLGEWLMTSAYEHCNYYRLLLTVTYLSFSGALPKCIYFY